MPPFGGGSRAAPLSSPASSNGPAGARDLSSGHEVVVVIRAWHPAARARIDAEQATAVAPRPSHLIGTVQRMRAGETYYDAMTEALEAVDLVSRL